MRVIALADCGVPLVIGSFDRIQAFLEAGLAVQPAQKEKQAYERASTDAILDNVLQYWLACQVEVPDTLDTHILNARVSNVRDEMKSGAYHTVPGVDARLEPRRESGKLLAHDEYC